MEKLAAKRWHCYNIYRIELLSEIIFPSEVSYYHFSSRSFPWGSNPLYFLWPISIRWHLASKPVACILSSEWHSTTALIQPTVSKSTFCCFSFPLDNLPCIFQQKWTCKLSCVPLSSPVLKKAPLVCTWWLRENSPPQLHLWEGGCQRRWGSWIPNALHPPSPLMFLRELFNTTTNEDTAEAILYSFKKWHNVQGTEIK